MPLRFPGAVSGQGPVLEGLVHAWGRTSGGGTPTLDSPSYGTSSITDSGVGLLDVTWTVPFASTTSYQVIWTSQKAENSATILQLSTTQSATAVQMDMLADPAGGYQWIAVGI